MRIWLLLLVPLSTLAQTPAVTRGAAIFRTTCAVAYCHGPDGTAGRAPQLAGHGFPARTVFGLVANGRPNTSMPGFANLLKTDDIEAVVAYVMTLKGDGPAAASTTPKAAALPPAIRKGRDLFFDAARTGACGACHELDSRGIPVGPDLRTRKPATLRGLRLLPTPHVVTVRATSEDPFPALVVEETPAQVSVYDLSAPLPVRRSFKPANVTLTPGGSWSHREAASLYSDEELDAIAGYLKWLP